MQIVGADVAEAVNLEVEVLELFCDSVVGEEPVAVGGDPDNAPGIVYNVVAFHVHIVQFIGRGETEGFNSMSGGVDIPYLPGVVVNPEVPPIIRQHIAVTDVELRMAADALGLHVEQITAGVGEDDPLVLQTECAIQGDAAFATWQAGGGCSGCSTTLTVDDAIGREKKDIFSEVLCGKGVVVVDNDSLCTADEGHAVVSTYPDVTVRIGIDIGHAVRR